MAIPFSVIFLLGIIWKRANNIAAISTMILGIIAIPITFWLQRNVLPEGFNFYNLVGIIGLFLFGWMIIVSLVTKPRTIEKSGSVIWSANLVKLSPSEIPNPYGWFKKDWLWWAIAFVATSALYIIFW